MTEAFIYDAVRTPRGRGKPGGALNGVTPIELCKTSLQAIKERNDFPIEEVEDVILGCVEPVSEQGGNIARVAALYAGYGEPVPGFQINRFCSSGLEAVNLAAARIMANQGEAVVAGGIESMSRVSMGQSGGSWATDPAVSSQLGFIPQGISADLLATLGGLSRHDVDTYAVESQRRAEQAWSEERFDKSIIPVTDKNGLIMLDRDEHMRPGTTIESLSKLNPSFTMFGQQFGFDEVALDKYPHLERVEHIHHAGNSSGIVDGSSAILLASEAFGTRHGLVPRARIVAAASVGTEPTLMLSGPAPASKKALRRAGMTPGDVDLWEINEAFAAVVIHAMRALEIEQDVVNVNGGAIALGHPLGATGAIILGTVLDELERRDMTIGLATLCVGAGMGTATIIERV